MTSLMKHMFKPRREKYEIALLESTMKNPFLGAVLLKNISINTNQKALWKSLELREDSIITRRIIEYGEDKETKDAIIFFNRKRRARASNYKLKGVEVDGCPLFSTYLGNSIMRMLHMEENSIQLYNMVTRKYNRNDHALTMRLLSFGNLPINLSIPKSLRRKLRMYGTYIVINEDEDLAHGNFEMIIVYEFFTEAYTALLCCKDIIYHDCMISVKMTRDPKEMMEYLGLDLVG